MMFEFWTNRKRKKAYKKQLNRCRHKAGYKVTDCPHCGQRLNICFDNSEFCNAHNCKATRGI